MIEIQRKLFETYKCDGKQIFDCKHGMDYLDRCMGYHIEGCSGCGSSVVTIAYAPLTLAKLWMLEDLLNEEYNIFIVEKMSNSTKITACPTPEQNWGCDEAYYRINVEEETKELAICQTAIKAYHNLPEALQARIKKMLETN